MNHAIAFFISLVVACLRISGVTHPAYQAIAHLYVGGLVAAALVYGFGWRTFYHEYSRAYNDGNPESKKYFRAMSFSTAWFYGGLAIALSVVEVVCFVWRGLTPS